ncbi:MAG: hypothetical protein U0Y68_07335 [Blastocatellia bacterium]
MFLLGGWLTDRLANAPKCAAWQQRWSATPPRPDVVAAAITPNRIAAALLAGRRRSFNKRTLSASWSVC